MPTHAIKRHNWALISIVAAVAFAIVIVALVMTPDRKTSSSIVPNNTSSVVNQGGLVLPIVQLEGSWYSEDMGTRFAGEVVGSHITVSIVGVDGEALAYWDGSFQASESAGSVITSNKNKEAFVLSLDNTKEFTINSDSITFQFRMDSIGLTKKVVMTRA